MNYRLLARPATRYDPLVERLRQAAHPDREAPPDFAPYLDKVRKNAYKVTDEDIEALKGAGYAEDVIFEQTVSVAVGAGLERLKAGLEVLP
jgi:alkylhydroperoxidase family enzyme